jgi:peptidoglycan/xylan/chitin deacetylase (PgdA/CDA1 family)
MRLSVLKPGFLLILAIGCMDREHKTAQGVNDPCSAYSCILGGIVRGDTNQLSLSIVFTGGDFGDGGGHILNVLKTRQVKSSFFFTGDFYRNDSFSGLISNLKEDGHYLGAHSDKHLLYCDWSNRDSLLVSKEEFLADLNANYLELERFGISRSEAKYFMPPYEWYNDSISKWTREAGLQLINFTPGTLSNADYTTPDLKNYKSSETIFQSIVEYEKLSSCGLNGFILLIHIGTAPERTDKFYLHLDDLILWLKTHGYQLVRIDELLEFPYHD